MSDSRIIGENGMDGSTEGYLCFELTNVGSKSESLQPIVESENGERTAIYVIGDNPFQNEHLRPLEGQTLQVRGKWRNGVLRVEPKDLTVLTPTPRMDETDG